MFCLIETTVIPILAFILGISICTSTSAMSVCYTALVILILFKPNFISSLKSTFRHRYVLCSTLFYLIFICGIFWSNAPNHDIWKMLIRIIGYFLAPLLLLSFQTNNAAKLILNGFVLGAILSAILSIISYILKQHFLYGTHDNSWVVFHGHILHSAFLAIASCFLLLSVLKRELTTSLRIYSCIAYLLCFIDVMFIVNGRTGMIMLLAMNAFIVLYQFKFKGILLLIGMGIVILPLLYFSPVVRDGIRNYNSDMHKYAQGDVKTSIGGRVIFHQVSLALIKAKPVFGYGTGSFATVYEQYMTANHIPEKTVNPHSDLLWIGVETGVLGIMFFVLMLIAAIIDVLKLTTFYRGIGISLTLGYVLASAQNSFFIDNVTGIAFGIILLGLIVCGSEVTT